MKFDLKHYKKRLLAKKNRQNRRVPPFAIARSNRKVQVNPQGNRKWRTQKLGITKRKLKKNLKL